MVKAIVSELQSFVKIAWTQPELNGSQLTGYRIEI